MRRWTTWFSLVCCVSLLALGCGSGGGGGTTGVTVTVAPKTATVIVNGTLQFVAAVTGGQVATIAASNGAVRAANVVTITTTSPHGLSTGQTVAVSGVSDSSFNGTFTIATVPSTTTFTYAQTGPDATSGGGTITTSAAKWFVNGVEGGDMKVGTISTTGLYTAPATLPPATTFTIASNGAARSNNVVTITTTAAHNLVVGQVVTISGVTDASFNGTFTVASVPSSTTFTYAQTAANATSGGGTVASTSVQIKATAVADNTKSDTALVSVDSGVRVSVTPATATVGTGEKFPFHKDVTGTTNKDVKWFVNDVEGGNATTGTISPAGEYTAPSAVPNPATVVTVKATSVADNTRSATASVTVVTAADPTLADMNPTSAAQGSFFQDVYLTGTNFISTTKVLFNGNPLDPSRITAVSGTLLRVRLPDSILAAATPPAGVPVQVQRQNQPPTAAKNFKVVPVRPALVGASPDSATQGAAPVTFNVNGGFFGAAGPPQQAVVRAEFDGRVHSAVINPANSARQLSVTIGGIDPLDLAAPGLISFAVRNTAAPQQVAVANFAVQPSAGSAALVGSPLSAGTKPGAVAINTATGIAVVANRGSDNLTLIDLGSLTVSGTPIALGAGAAPTGVAVDNVRNLAVVANNGRDSVSIVDLALATPAVTATITRDINTKPFSVGVNPQTGLALVAYQPVAPAVGTNVASIIDLNLNPPAVVGAVTIGAGTNPQVAVEPRLNWAIVTPGGGVGSLSIVDLSRRNSSAIAAPSASPPGASRTANVVTITTTAPHGLITGQAVLITGVTDTSFNGYFTVASVPNSTTFTYSQTGSNPDKTSGGGAALHARVLASVTVGPGVTGIAINPETEKAVLADPTTNTVVILSALDQTSTSFAPPDGCPSSLVCAFATAINPLTDTAVSVNFARGEATVIDPRTPKALGTPIAVGTNPKAVAIDPGSNLAVIANEGSNNVSFISLGAIRPLHITQLVLPNARQFAPSTPTATLTSATDLPVTILGKGFVNTTKVRLDGTEVLTANVVFRSDRRLDVTLPAATFLSAARRYAVDVVNSTGDRSNVADLTVIQPVDVTGTGCTAPAPRAVAIDAERNQAVVTNPGCNNVSLIKLNDGTIANTVAVGKSPQGVAIISRTSKVVVTNRSDNTASVVDLSKTPPAVSSTVSVGTEPIGVAINQDTAKAVVANSGSNNVSLFSTEETNPTATTVTVDQRPVAVAIDSVRNLAMVAASTQNTLNQIDLSQATPTLTVRYVCAQDPTGVVFDPAGGVFVASCSLDNSLTIADPATQSTTSLFVGINPTSLAYNFQSSTLVTLNTASNTMSVVDFLGRRVRAVLGITGSPQLSVDIHPRTNLAVIADEANNRVLLVPLPR